MNQISITKENRIKNLRDQDCFCVDGKSACKHPDSYSCACYHVQYGMNKISEIVKKLSEDK